MTTTGLTENATVQHDANLPAVARDLQRIEFDRTALFEEYRTLLLRDDADVSDDDRTRFSEVVSVLNIDTAQIAKDAELIGKVRALENKIAQGERWDAKAAELRAQIDKLKDKGPQYDRLQSDLRTAETRASLASRLRVELAHAKRGSKRAAELFGYSETIEESRRGPLPSGAVRLG